MYRIREERLRDVERRRVDAAERQLAARHAALELRRPPAWVGARERNALGRHRTGLAERAQGANEVMSGTWTREGNDNE